jgi:hypothetical protein
MRRTGLFLQHLLLPLVVVLALAPAARADTDPVGTWPLQPEPEVVALFDPPDGPYGPGHRGVDLAGAAGQAVLTALAGEVSFVGSIAGRGVVTVTHGATRTTYEPVVGLVPLGTPVTAGQAIGTLQAGPSHCAPRTCLHWGWIEGETYLDPLRLVGAGPVRLLPLWQAPLAPPLLPSVLAAPDEDRGGGGQARWAGSPSLGAAGTPGAGDARRAPRWRVGLVELLGLRTLPPA